MKIAKMGSLEFVDLVACGGHSGRLPDSESVWDLSCHKCALRYETAERLASRIATRLRKLKQEIPEQEKRDA
jgi:hypothetical protein